jgi:hypothetical protein
MGQGGQDGQYQGGVTSFAVTSFAATSFAVTMDPLGKRGPQWDLITPRFHYLRCE